MPIRAGTTLDVPSLVKAIQAIDKARTSGSLQELRISGVMSRSGPISQTDLDTRIYQYRYELYLRGQAGDSVALGYEPKNPWQEKGMKVHSRSSVGVFGYPLPAPLVPPNP